MTCCCCGKNGNESKRVVIVSRFFDEGLCTSCWSWASNTVMGFLIEYSLVSHAQVRDTLRDTSKFVAIRDKPC